MLKSYVEARHPFEATTTYYTATFNPDGAQALAWSAFDQLLTGDRLAQEWDVAEYLLESIPDTVHEEAVLIGRPFEWELVESVLRRFGGKVVDAAKKRQQDGRTIDDVWEWPEDIAADICLVGARAKGLAGSLASARNLALKTREQGMTGLGTRAADAGES